MSTQHTPQPGGSLKVPEMSRLAWYTAAMLALAGALYAAGDAGLRRVEESAALRCARASDGTDSSIAECYTSRGLAVPEDL